MSWLPGIDAQQVCWNNRIPLNDIFGARLYFKTTSLPHAENDDLQLDNLS